MSDKVPIWLYHYPLNGIVWDRIKLNLSERTMNKIELNDIVDEADWLQDELNQNLITEDDIQCMYIQSRLT